MVLQSKEPTASAFNHFQANDTAEYSHGPVILHLNDFKPDSTDQSIQNTADDLFRCIVVWKAGSSESMQPFPGLQSLVNSVRQHAADKEVSYVS